MQATTRESVSQETSSVLQLKKALLPIEEYAARQGLSRCAVEQRVQSGIIQVRKCKGKTYVVDVPLSLHPHTPEGLSLMEGNPEMNTCVIEQPTQSADTTHADRISDGPPPIESVSQGIPIPRADPFQSGILSMVAWSRRARRVVAVAATACLLAVIIAGFYLYINQTTYSDRLDRAYATIQAVHNNSVQTNQQLAALQTNLVDSTVEFQSVKNELNKTTARVTNLQNELKRVGQSLETTENMSPGSTAQITELRNLLNNTRAELQTLRSQIAQTDQSLETIKQQNATALERLRGQIQQLTTLLSELAKNSRPPTDPNATDE
jgi:peptidoglycan hydrolase CwlO-like protein